MITRHIPNIITCCNLVSGCIATMCAFAGDLHLALLWIVAGAVFDFFDGFAARWLKVSSPIGKELDSLADVVTFGVAPSTMVFALLGDMPYPSVLEPYRSLLPYFAFIMAAFSALRLAKFNLDERQATSFIGMPTPANALFWGSLTVGGGELLMSSAVWLPVVLVLVLVMSVMLVAELPMFALKFKSWAWRGNAVKYVFLATCVPLILWLGVASLAVIIAWYIVLSLCTARR